MLPIEVDAIRWREPASRRRLLEDPADQGPDPVPRPACLVDGEFTLVGDGGDGDPLVALGQAQGRRERPLPLVVDGSPDQW